uniref:Uncharacterized protein n=1 Tax=Anguilla anguilla TaxID=7936 RepID=A0A0E9WG37_ANGAN
MPWKPEGLLRYIHGGHGPHQGEKPGLWFCGCGLGRVGTLPQASSGRAAQNRLGSLHHPEHVWKDRDFNLSGTFSLLILTNR